MSSITGATVGTFVVGDGTVVGQEPQTTFVLGKSRLILKGGTFITDVFAGEFVVALFLGKPRLALTSKKFYAVGSSTVAVGKPKLVLRSKAFATRIPIFAHMDRAFLTLRGKVFITVMETVLVFGKPTLWLRAKEYAGKELALTPSTPVELILVPTSESGLTLAVSEEENLVLVPTTEEFR